MQPQDIIGQLSPPPGVSTFNAQVGGDNPIGLFVFINLLIRVGTIVAGLFVLYNLVMAGFDYVSSAGDSKGATQAREKITNSVIGLVIIVAAYTIVGLLGLIFFNDPLFFIQPEICGPQGCSSPVGGGGGSLMLQQP